MNNTKIGHVLFFSYATLDSRTYQVSNIAQRLKGFEGIQDILFWEEDADSNIIEFMNDGLYKCDIFILFCSRYALQSQWVQKEWTAAVQLGKRIIPIFQDHHEIPALLSPNLGLRYKYDMPEKFIQELYQLIMKKIDDAEAFGSLEQQFIAWIQENRPKFYINVNLSRYNLQQTQKINLIKNISSYADHYCYKVIKGLQDLYPEEYRYFAENSNFRDNLKYVFWYCPIDDWHPKESKLKQDLEFLRKKNIWEKDFNSLILLIEEFLKIDFVIAEQIANDLKDQLKFSDPEYGLIADTWEDLEKMRKEKKELIFRFNKTLEIAESFYSKGDFVEAKNLIKRCTIIAAQNKFPMRPIEELESKIKQVNEQSNIIREKLIELRTGSLKEQYYKIIKFIRLEGYNLVPLRNLSLNAERDIRNTAAILIGYIQVYQLFPAFLKLLEEVKEFEQLQLLVAFNQVATMKSEQIIEILNDENEYLVFNAIMASGHYYSDTTIQYLMSNLRKDFLFIRVASIAILGLSGDSRTIDPLKEMYNDPNPIVRLLIITVLVRFHSSRVEDLLLKALKDPNKEVQLRVIHILSEIKSEKALPLLIKIYNEKKQDQEIHYAIIQALCEIRSETSIELLFDAINEKNPKIQELVQDTLESMKHEKKLYVQNMLIKFINGNPFAKSEILHSLERIGNHAIEILQEYIVNPENTQTDYKIGAAIVLALLKGIRLIPDLLDLFTKSTRNFMTHFSNGLESVLTYNISNLSDTLLNDDPYIRLLCILALSELRDEYTTELLLLNENDKDLRVRMVLMTVLGILGNDRVLNSFSVILNNENEDVGLRKIAARSLGRLRIPRAMLQLLLLLLKDSKSHLSNPSTIRSNQTPVRNAVLESIRENVDYFPNEARDAVDKLTNTVNSPIFPSRNKAIILELLGFIKESIVFDILLNYLLNKKEELILRTSACKGLGYYGDKRAIMPIQKFFIEFQDDNDVLRIALRSLQRINDPEIVVYFINLYKNLGISLQIRSVVIKMLGDMADPEITTVLIGALNEERQEIWHVASNALIKRNDMNTTFQLIQSLEKYCDNKKIMGHLRYLLSLRDLLPFLENLNPNLIPEFREILKAQGGKYHKKLKLLKEKTTRQDLKQMLEYVLSTATI